LKVSKEQLILERSAKRDRRRREKKTISGQNARATGSLFFDDQKKNLGTV